MFSCLFTEQGLILVMEGLKFEQVQDSLKQILQFLEPYLSVANAHAADFITKDHWNKLTKPVQDSLLELSSDQLKNLPYSAHCVQSARSCTLDTTHEAKNFERDRKDTGVKSEKGTFITENSITLLSSGGASELNTGSLKDLYDLAREATIEGKSLQLTKDDFLRHFRGMASLGCTGAHMNQKKSHEVEIMAEICSTLVQSTKCQLVRLLTALNHLVLSCV